MQTDNLSESSHVSLLQPYGQVIGDHTGLLQNHIWKEGELKEKLTTLYHHKPQTYTDHAMQKTVWRFDNPQRSDKTTLWIALNDFLSFILLDVWFVPHIQFSNRVHSSESIGTINRMAPYCSRICGWCPWFCCSRYKHFELMLLELRFKVSDDNFLISEYYGQGQDILGH